MKLSKHKMLQNDKEHQLLFNLFFEEYNYEINYSEINYSRLFTLISKHRVVNHFFDLADIEKFPKSFIEKLKIARLKQKQRALKQLSILIELKHLLHQYNFIVLKGVTLSQQIYNDFAYRDSSDVDILVKPKDEKEIIKILLKNNYTKSHNYEHHFVLKRHGISIEIHRKLSATFKTNKIENNSWKNLQTIKLNNHSFNILNNYSQNNYLLINGATHQWNKFSLVLDYFNFQKKINLQNVNSDFTYLKIHLNNIFIKKEVNSFEERYILHSLLTLNNNSLKQQIIRAYYFSKISNHSYFKSFYKSFIRMSIKSLSK